MQTDILKIDQIATEIKGNDKFANCCMIKLLSPFIFLNFIGKGRFLTALAHLLCVKEAEEIELLN